MARNEDMTQPTSQHSLLSDAERASFREHGYLIRKILDAQALDPAS